MLKKLECYGISGDYNKWLKNFLSERKQKVYINGSFSYETPVLSGVPQGSVLGPLLFVLYINDLVQFIRTSELKTFADDTKLSHPISNAEDKEALQEDLNRVIEWSHKNNMDLNKKKFDLVCHQGKVNNSVSLLKELPFFENNFTYDADDVAIHATEVVRDLGVYVDRQLNWESHVAKITLQARKMTFWILNVFKTRDKYTLMLLFNSLIRSRLEYCCEVWDRSSINVINKIEQIQRQFTRKIRGLEDTNYWDRLKILNIFSLQRRRERQRIIHVWKLKNGLIRNDVKLQFKRNERTSRDVAVVLPLPKVKGKILSIYEDSFVIRSARIWNKIPSEITSVAKLSGFKIKLDKWLSGIPDNPPVNGYYHETKNSILDYFTTNLR